MESQASTPHSNGALPTLAPFHHGLKLLVRTPLRSALIKPCAPASVLAPLLVRRIPRTNTSTSLNVTLTAIKPAERTRLFWSRKWTCPEAHGRQASTALVLDCRLAVSSNAAVGRPVQRTCVLSLKCSSKTDLRCNDATHVLATRSTSVWDELHKRTQSRWSRSTLPFCPRLAADRIRIAPSFALRSVVAALSFFTLAGRLRWPALAVHLLRHAGAEKAAFRLCKRARLPWGISFESASNPSAAGLSLRLMSLSELEFQIRGDPEWHVLSGKMNAQTMIQSLLSPSEYVTQFKLFQLSDMHIPQLALHWRLVI